MEKYKISCTNCALKISMLLPTRPIKCPACKEYFGYNDVDDGDAGFSGVKMSDNFVSGGQTYIHAEGDCSIESNSDIVMDVKTVVTALKGAKVEMNNPIIDKNPIFPDEVIFKGVVVSRPKVLILETIVKDVIGTKQTLKMTPVELKRFFIIVQNRVYNGLVEGLNAGALTGIRELFSDSDQFIKIIDSEQCLTDNGVELLKFTAHRVT